MRFPTVYFDGCHYQKSINNFDQENFDSDNKP